jgi:hypothetical protein
MIKYRQIRGVGHVVRLKDRELYCHKINQRGPVCYFREHSAVLPLKHDAYKAYKCGCTE